MSGTDTLLTIVITAIDNYLVLNRVQKLEELNC